MGGVLGRGWWMVGRHTGGEQNGQMSLMRRWRKLETVWKVISGTSLGRDNGQMEPYVEGDRKGRPRRRNLGDRYSSRGQG